jgi:hypothetical protein
VLVENTLAQGVLTNWLANIGVVSLIYWGWRIVRAASRRLRSDPDKKPNPQLQPAIADAPADDVVAIAAAVHAVIGAHRIIHLQPVAASANWTTEGRWMLQTSHKPR